MPSATFLHIQPTEGSPARVLELSGDTVRIGNGLRCEVRLADKRLAEVQCLLKRRGAVWHLLPVGPSGRIFLDGRPVDGQCILRDGSHLRVGGHRLMLRSSADTLAPLGSFERPIPVEPVAPSPDACSSPSPPGESEDRLEAQRQRLESWQAHVEARQRQLRDRERERRVAGRWKAAGEPRLARTPPPTPTPASPLRRPPRIQVAPDEPALLAPTPDPDAKPPTGFVLRPAPPLPPRAPEPVEPVPSWDDDATDDPLDGETFVVPGLPPEATVAELPPPLAEEPCSPPVESDEPWPPEPAGRDDGDTSPASPTSGPAADESGDHGPFVAHTGQHVPWSWHEGPLRDHRPLPLSPDPMSRAEWPSARDLIAAHRLSRGGPAGAPESRERVAAHAGPCPTLGEAPATWSIPAWAGVGPAAAAVLSLFALGLSLATIWAQDDRVAGVMADRLFDPKASPQRTIDVPEGPGSAWWATTAGHLFLRAMTDSRRQDDPDRAEQVRFDLEAARGAAPLNREVRLASAADARTALGLSHDVVALRRTGQALMAAGRTPSGRAALRRALELASRVEIDRASIPTFNEDAQVRRFTLPHEDEMARIVLDALPRTPGPDDLACVEAVLPSSPIAALAAYRVLRERGCAGSDRLLDRVLDHSADSQDPIMLAAQAEALAYRGNWDQAAERYRTAVQRTPPALASRRALAVNLAEVESRLGHEEAVRSAWDEARGSDPADPINLRVAEARQRLGEPGRPGRLTLPPTRPRRDDRLAPATYRVP